MFGKVKPLCSNLLVGLRFFCIFSVVSGCSNDFQKIISKGTDCRNAFVKETSAGHERHATVNAQRQGSVSFLCGTSFLFSFITCHVHATHEPRPECYRENIAIRVRDFSQGKICFDTRHRYCGLLGSRLGCFGES